MNGKRRKCAVRAFDNNLVPLHKIQNIYAAPLLAACVVFDWRREPVPARFDERGLMKPGPFLSPPLSRSHFRYVIDKMLARIVLVPIPTNVPFAVFDVDRPRQTVQSQAVPIPQLESENVWR